MVEVLSGLEEREEVVVASPEKMRQFRDGQPARVKR